MSRKKILVIDDEEEMVTLLTMRFESCGYEVLTAFNGVEGLEVARTEMPDLVILDVMMPKMNGYEVCKKLKGSDVTKNIVVVMLTAKLHGDEGSIGERIGADDYIIKPFDAKELVGKVAKYLNA
jgi:DNA-binding response OmpR family regulator